MIPSTIMSNKIEVKETVKPYVPSAEDTPPEVIHAEPVTVVQPRSVSSIEEEEDGEERVSHEIREVAEELDGFQDYQRELRNGNSYEGWP